MRRFAAPAAIWLFAILPGVVTAIVNLRFALLDWVALRQAYSEFETVAGDSTSDLRQIYLADAYQNAHRLNLFAEGTWTLLGLILLAIGLHAIVTRTTDARKAP